MTISRRDLLAGTAGVLAGAGLGLPAFAQGAAAPDFKPEAGASLRLLRWSPFVQGDEDAWLANTKKFTERRPASKSDDRQGKLGRHPSEVGRGRERRIRPRHGSRAGSTIRTSIRTSWST
jgi:hypothetical protein